MGNPKVSIDTTTIGELTEEFIEEETNSPVELLNYRIQLREKRLPLAQQLALIDHEIKQVDDKIKIAYALYFQNKEK